MTNRVQLEKEIKEYCQLNNINDVAGFITQCMLMGFNTVKYGVSPQDNVKRENNEVDTKSTNKVKKEKTKKEPIKISKRTIKIIEND